jgi:hypothetical protein
MALEKQCQEETSIDRFANDYIAFLQEEIGYRSWLPRVKVLECDEVDWSGLYNLQAKTSSHEWTDSKMRSYWLRRADAFSLPAIMRSLTGEVRRSTEIERMARYIELGVRQNLANMIARFDAVIFLRKMRFKTTGAKLQIVASRCAVVTESMAYAEVPQPSRRAFGKNLPVNPRLLEQFKNKIGPAEFAKRYLQSQHTG